MTELDGPRLVEPAEAATTVAALGDLWLAVTRAGGAVGHVQAEPEERVRADARTTIADVLAGRLHMLAVDAPDGGLLGVVFIEPGIWPRVVHRGLLLRLMVHPTAQGRGLGRTLLHAAVARARALGLEQLLLSARGGTDLPAFYVAAGWTPVGVFPDALHLGGDERRDEHWFQLRL